MFVRKTEGTAVSAERVRRFLDERDIDYDLQTHERAVTAQEVAAAEHESGWHVAKPVILSADGELVMAVVAAASEVDLGKATAALGAADVGLADEDDFGAAFPDCEVGAEPPLGNVYDVPVVFDETLVGEERLVFRAGTHDTTMSMATEDYLEAVQPTISDIAVPAD